MPLASRRIHPLIVNPAILISNTRASWLERDELNEIVRSGCAVWLQATTVDTDRGKITAKRAKMRAVYNPSLRGESASMKPASPEHGAVSSSRYARLLDGFATGNRTAIELFKSRKTVKVRNGVPHALTMQTMERSILYFPNEGRVTRYGKATSDKVILVRKTEDGWEVRDRSVSRDVIWTLVTEAEAQEALRKGARLIESTF